MEQTKSVPIREIRGQKFFPENNTERIGVKEEACVFSPPRPFVAVEFPERLYSTSAN